MNEAQALKKLEVFIQSASFEEVLFFVESLVKKYPDLRAPLLARLASAQPKS